MVQSFWLHLWWKFWDPGRIYWCITSFFLEGFYKCWELWYCSFGYPYSLTNELFFLIFFLICAFHFSLEWSDVDVKFLETLENSKKWGIISWPPQVLVGLDSGILNELYTWLVSRLFLNVRKELNEEWYTELYSNGCSFSGRIHIVA